MILAAVPTLALGMFVAEQMRPWAVLVLFFAAAPGALAFALILPGGFTCLLWPRLGEVGARQYRAFTLIGLLLGLRLVFGLLFGAGPMWGPMSRALPSAASKAAPAPSAQRRNAARNSDRRNAPSACPTAP